MRPPLTGSTVTFDEFSHTYTTADGRRLSGVTAILSRHLFADKYSGIPQATLDRAAAYGSNIHEQIELYDALGAEADTEVARTYQAIKDSHGLVTVANEYLVSDNEAVASSIDIVFGGADDDTFDLCDIKTTSHLDRDYVSWQLSCYAYLFELQNPGLRAGRLLAFWYPRPRYGRPALVEVERKPAAMIRRLIDADTAGLIFYPDDTATEGPVRADELISRHSALLSALLEAERTLKEQKETVDRLRAELLEVMTLGDMSSITTEGMTVTRREPSVTRRLDSARLQADYPDVYADCLKESATRASLSVKLTA